MSTHLGVCTDCGKELPRLDEARAHMSETNPGTLGTSSHKVRVLNPPREDIVRRCVLDVIDGAIGDAIYELDKRVDRGEFTDAEIAAALASAGFPDFADAWHELVGGPR